MPIRVDCLSCGGRLNAPDHLAGRKAKCPRCHSILSIEAAAPPAVSPPAPKERKLAKPRKPQPEERIIAEPETRNEPEAEEEVVAAKAAKKTKRKKRRRPPKRSEQQVPTWVWWLVSLGGFSILAGIMALTAIRLGHGAELFAFSVIMAVMLPLSTIILILSMFISSWLGGGIEFGEAHIVIPKAIGLLLIINLIMLLPFGGFLAAPVWLFGLMILFHLDLWESRILVAVNWGLNSLVRLAVLGMLMNAFSHGDPRLGPMKQRGQQAAASEQEQAMEAIADLGGDYSTENDADDAPVVSVTLAGTRAPDAALARLKSFPNLRNLDLDSTPITDAGLAHLEGLTSLRSLNLSRTFITDAGLARLKKLNRLETLTLTGTRVTRAGIADLQTALPQVRITP